MVTYPEILNITQANNLMQQGHESGSELLGLLTGIIVVATLHKNNKTQNEKHLNSQQINKIFCFIYTLIALINLPILIIFLSIFWLYKKIVYLLLILKYGNKFGGFLTGPDTFWSIKDDSNSVINILLIASTKYPLNENITNIFKIRLNKFINKTNSCEKLLFKLCKFMGYSYLIKGEINVDDCVGELNQGDYTSKEHLEETLSKLASIDLSSGKLFEVLIGNEYINWGNRSCNYPVILRFHHSVGDGLALMQMLLACLGCKEIEQVVEEKDVPMQTMLPVFIYNKFRRKCDENILHGKRLSGENIIVWKTEARVEYVKKVKEIKKVTYNCGFFDVIASVLAASLRDFYNEKNDKVKHISAIVPAVPNNAKFKNLHHPTINLCNAFSVGLLDIPIKSSNKKYTTLKRFRDVINNVFNLKKTCEYQINYWFLQIIMSLFPEQLIQPIIKMSEGTLILSNLPGPKKQFIIDERFLLEDLIFWVPHKSTTGVSVSIFSYDDRFQIGISIDKIYGITKPEAAKIIEGIFKYIDDLHHKLTIY